MPPVPVISRHLSIVRHFTRACTPFTHESTCTVILPKILSTVTSRCQNQQLISLAAKPLRLSSYRPHPILRTYLPTSYAASFWVTRVLLSSDSPFSGHLVHSNRGTILRAATWRIQRVHSNKASKRSRVPSSYPLPLWHKVRFCISFLPSTPPSWLMSPYFEPLLTLVRDF